MKRLLRFLALLRRLDELERRVSRLEADLAAQANFKRMAHTSLNDDKRKMPDRHESALQTLVCSGYVVPATPTSPRKTYAIGRDYKSVAQDRPVSYAPD